jgi:hypothetical protein
MFSNIRNIQYDLDDEKITIIIIIIMRLRAIKMMSYARTQSAYRVMSSLQYLKCWMVTFLKM